LAIGGRPFLECFHRKYDVRATPGGHYHDRVRMLKRIAAGIGLVTGFLAYVWYAAVRAVPEVKRRKAARRR
jgi:hypothetical protein